MCKKVKIERVVAGEWTSDGYELREYWSPSDYYYWGSFDTPEEARECAAKEGWEVVE